MTGNPYRVKIKYSQQRFAYPKFCPLVSGGFFVYPLKIIRNFKGIHRCPD